MKKMRFGVNEKIIERNVCVHTYFNDVRKCGGNLVEDNLKLVISIANMYVPIMPLEDLIQEGNIGLIKAAMEYGDDVTCAFSTFATPFIRGAITSAIENDSRIVRRPHHAQDGFAWNESLDEPIVDGEGDSCTRMDFLVSDTDIEKDHEREEMTAMLSECLDRLTERERLIVMSYYGIGTDIPMGYGTISEVLGMSAERVRQLHLGALEKMRQ